MRDWVLSNPIEKKKQMGLDEDSSGTPLDLGIRIGNGGPPSVQLNLLPLGSAPHDSASSEDLPWPRDQGSLGFRRSIDVNELPPHSTFPYFNVDSDVFPLIQSYAGSVKRERVTEESEAEKMASRISDEEESSKKKLRLSKHDSAVLEESFKENSNLNPRQKQELAKRLNLRPRQVEVWFQNKRARIKLKQTEMDHEFLRRYRDSLTEENRRLHRELQELRALKVAVASELCMQTPVATVSVCPSCKRVVTADNSSMPNTLLPKPHFYSACMHSPVAC